MKIRHAKLALMLATAFSFAMVVRNENAFADGVSAGCAILTALVLGILVERYPEP